MDYDYGNLILSLLGIISFFEIGKAAECRGSQVDSDNRSWIEDSRPLPDEDLSYIAARFCEDDPVLIQIWDKVPDTKKFRLLWQRELRPDGAYLGQVQVFPVPDPFRLKSTYRYGIAASLQSGNFPVETIFDSNERSGKYSVTSQDQGVFAVGEVKEFSELRTPHYFHVWFRNTRECPSEEELVHTYEEQLNPRGDTQRELDSAEPPPGNTQGKNSTGDECHPESLHAASGRIMLEERTSFIPMVAKAMEFYLCDDTMFHVQLWEPMEGRKYKLVWSKDIIPDENSGGGYRRTTPLDEEERVYLQPYYRLALHVPDENKRIPVPSKFSYSENVVFSEMKKEKFHRCDTQLFEDFAFPYNFRIQFCSETDCSDKRDDVTWTADVPQSLDALPSLECPEVITDLTETNPDIISHVDSVTTEKPATNNTQQSSSDKSDDHTNRTKIANGSQNPENELEVLRQNPKTGKSSSAVKVVIYQMTLFTATTIGYWLALL